MSMILLKSLCTLGSAMNVNVASGPNWFYNTKKILCFWDQKRSCCGFYNTFIAELRVVNLSINREGFKNPVKTEYERPLMDFKSFFYR